MIWQFSYHTLFQSSTPISSFYSGIHPQADTGPEVFALIWASQIDIGYEESKVTEKSERGGRPLVAPWSGPW